MTPKEFTETFREILKNGDLEPEYFCYNGRTYSVKELKEKGLWPQKK